MAWFVANTHPHKERFALENLQRQGYNCYCPLVIRRIRHARRSFDAKRPMFASYLFIEEASAQGRWRPILSTFGIRSLVLQGEQPALLAKEFVEALKLREVDGAVCKPVEQLQPGQSVQITGGHFDGLIGNILELRDSDRVLVLLELMKSTVKVQLSPDTVRPAPWASGV